MAGGFIYAGSFSLINRALERALREVAGESVESVEAVETALAGRGLARWLAYVRAGWHFRRVVVRERIPPWDLVVRLPVFSEYLGEALVERRRDWRWSLQTQSLFDAGGGEVPHYIYTDHTFLANGRYDPPRPTWPVYPGWLELERRAYERARVIFVSSRFAGESLVEDYGLPAERVEVVGSGSNIEPPVEIGERGGAKILFVGVEWERKGGPQLVEALRGLRRRFPAVELEVVGCEGEGEAGVRFHGRVGPERVREFYQRADIFCLPSLAEPSASVLAEAAAFGLPIVATRVGGTPERVVDGETGILVEPGDESALEGALGSLIGQPGLARVMGDRGRERMLRDFTWAGVASRIMKRIHATIQS